MHMFGGMASLDKYLDEQLARGRACFSREEALAALGMSPDAFVAAAARLARKRRLVNPRRGFYLILRPEERVAGAPDPARWIDPMMNYLGLDYRISLLRAAAFHGATHQAAMVFQVIVPKQLRAFDTGRHRLQFIYQAPKTFSGTNRPEWLAQLKTGAGFAKVAGVELTLLDCVRYYRKAAGISGVAQIVKDIGDNAESRKLAQAARNYENSAVRRLGYLLERYGHARLSRVLEPFAKRAKSMKPLDPAAKPGSELMPEKHEQDAKWKLVINVPVEVDF